jgi:hypothetical protein
MALELQYWDLPMNAGLVEAALPEVLDPSAGFSRVDNLVQDKSGSLAKRPGAAALLRDTATGGTLTKALRLLVKGETDPLVIDGQHLYARTTEADVWVQRDRVPTCAATRRGGVQPGGKTTFAGYEMAAKGNYRIVTYSTSDDAGLPTLFACIIDATTESTVHGPVVLEAWGFVISQIRHKIVVVGDVAIVIYDLLDGQLRARRIVLTSATTINVGWSGAVAITAIGEYGLVATTWDACAMSDRFFVSFGTTVLTVLTRSYAATAGFPPIQTAAPVALTPECIGCAVSEGDTMWVSWIEDLTPTMVRVIGYMPPDLAVVLATQATIITEASLGTFINLTRGIAIQPTTAGLGHLIVCSDMSGGPAAKIDVRQFQTTAGACATDGAQRLNLRVALFTKPWRVDGRIYIGVTSASIVAAEATSRFRGAYVVDVTDLSTTLRPVASLAPGVVSLTRAWAMIQPHNVAIQGTTVEYLLPVLLSGQVTSLQIVKIDHAATNRWQPVDLGGAVQMSGGVGSYFDGVRVAEQGFMCPPEIGTIVQSGAVGLPDGAYTYTVIYEQVDAAGNVHWSEPAEARVFTVTGGPRIVDVQVKILPITARQDADDNTSPVHIVLYRTQVAPGLTFFRHSVLENIQTAGQVTFVDTTGDVQLSTRPLLYTQPGTPGTALPRRAPPSLTCIVQHGDSLAGVADDGNTIWFSAAHIPGEGVWWNPLMTSTVEDPGRIVALASFDGRLYAWTRTRIWVIDGAGFTDNGSAGYSAAQRLAVDVGCIEARSVVVTPMGALFQSDWGICLLSRAGQVTWFGEVVRDTLAAFPIITSGTYNSAEGKVVFTCVDSEGADGATGTGVQLVFNPSTGTWSRYIHTGYDGTVSEAPQSAAMCVLGGTPRLHWIGADGYMYRDDPTTGLDVVSAGNAWASYVLETPWIKLAGLQGYQRVWRILLLLRRFTDHSITVELAYDDDPAYVETFSWTAAEIAALPREQLEVRPKRQKSQAIRMRVTDSQSGTVGAGLGSTVLGFRFGYGVKRKTALAAAHR